MSTKWGGIAPSVELYDMHERGGSRCYPHDRYNPLSVPIFEFQTRVLTTFLEQPAWFKLSNRECDSLSCEWVPLSSHFFLLSLGLYAPCQMKCYLCFAYIDKIPNII